MSLPRVERRRPDHRFDESLSLADAVRFAERHWVLMLACPLLLGLMVLLVVVFVFPPKYVSAATLVAVPPSVSSDLQPTVLTVHGFKTLLESDGVIQATQQRLIEEGMLEPDRFLVVDRDLSVRIFVSRREETTSLAPMLEAVGRADDPETAAALANTWVAVLLERVEEVQRSATLVGATFVEEQYPRVQADLQKRETERVSLWDEYQVKYQELANRSDQRIHLFSKETTDLVASHKSESRSIVEGSARGGLEADLPEDVRAGLAELAGVRAQMAQTASILVLEKAISDDALWQSQLSQEVVDPRLAEELLTQEPNPVYQDLALRAIHIEGSLKQDAAAALDEVSELIRELERIQRERSASLAKLEAGRGLELTALRRRGKRELDTIGRERDLKISIVTREIDQLTELNAKLAKEYREAILARSQETVDVIYLASPAVVMNRPEDSQIALKTVVALILGGLIGLVLAVVREVHERQRAAS